MNEDLILELNSQAELLDSGFDDAIIGVGCNTNRDIIAIYSRTRCIDIISSQGIENSDAIELFNRMASQLNGIHTPMFMAHLWELD